jgi:Flp pilus assembly protein TadG
MRFASMLTTRIQAVGHSQDGSTAIIFAFCTLALCGGLGLSIDLTIANRAKTSMQHTLDSAVIAVASVKQAESGVAADRLAAYMSANWREKYGIVMPTTTLDSSAANLVTATASAEMPTVFMRVFGYQKIDLWVESQGRFGLGQAEVALALDTTGSMAGTKIEALKTAAEDLVRDVFAKPDARSKVKFSVVPFAQYVNVGMGQRSAPWLSVPNDRMVTKTREVPVNPGLCVTRTGYWTNDSGQTVPYDYQDCTGVPMRTETYQEEEKWTGCVGSRASPKDAQVVLDASDRVEGLMNTWCGSPMMRLSNHESDVRNAIKDLTPNGQTYMAPGLLWAWRTLSPTAPFNDGAPKAGPTRARKVIVLMTDGANTASTGAWWTGDWTPYHEGWDANAANAKTNDVCNNVKADNVEIFAIAFEVVDPLVLARLQACATSPVTHYFNASDSVKLAEAFGQIGESLSQVRLSK